MEVPETVGTDALLQDLGGCGMFQVILAAIFGLTTLPGMFGFLLMTFVVYNPGWKCLDNSTVLNGTNISSSIEWEREDCELFDRCKNVQFNPEASTLVTEWGLTCNRGFILSSILAIANAGGLVSTLMVGFIGDKYGRKMPLIISRLFIIGLNIAAIYSVSWEMHAIVLFFTEGFNTFRTLMMVLVNEYMVPNWRVKVNSLPFDSIASVVFTVVAMMYPEWKTIRWIAIVLCAVTTLPILWMPRSLRWLTVNGDADKALEVAKRVAKLNKAEMPTKQRIDQLTKANLQDMDNNKSNTTVIDLFRPGYKLTSFILVFINVSISIMFFVIGFNIAAMPGDFFINLLIYNVSDFPSYIVVFLLGNRYRRKPTMITSFLALSVSFFGMVATILLSSGDVERWVSLGLALTAKMALVVIWIFVNTVKMEAYPTVARSTVNSFTWLFVSLGGVVAPYLIPQSPGLIWISCLALGMLGIVNAISVLFLPETRDQLLKDTWDDKVDEKSEKTNKVV